MVRLEDRWLCRLARRSVPASTLADLAEESTQLDWHTLVAAAERHGVSELLLAPLTSSAVNVPAAIVDRLESRVFGAISANLSRTAQLAHVLDRFGAHGIRALTFKGPALTSSVYGHLGRRRSTAIDLLVDRRDAARVRPLLLADGYVLPPRRRHRGGSLLYGLFPGAGRDDTLLPPPGDLAAIDVHVGFAFWVQGIRLDTDRLFRRAVTVDVAGMPLPTLCDADLLLVLSIHGMMHRWSVLRLVSDIDAVSAKVDDWDSVIEEASRARMLRVLWVAVLLSHGVLGTAFPAELLARASSDGAAAEIAGGVQAHLFDPVESSAAFDPKKWSLRFQDRSIDRLRFHTRDLVYEWFLKWPWDQWLGRRRRPRPAN